MMSMLVLLIAYLSFSSVSNGSSHREKPSAPTMTREQWRGHLEYLCKNQNALDRAKADGQLTASDLDYIANYQEGYLKAVAQRLGDEREGEGVKRLILGDKGDAAGTQVEATIHGRGHATFRIRDLGFVKSTLLWNAISPDNRDELPAYADDITKSLAKYIERDTGMSLQRMGDAHWECSIWSWSRQWTGPTVLNGQEIHGFQMYGGQVENGQFYLGIDREQTDVLFEMQMQSVVVRVVTDQRDIVRATIRAIERWIPRAAAVPAEVKEKWVIVVENWSKVNLLDPSSRQGQVITNIRSGRKVSEGVEFRRDTELEDVLVYSIEGTRGSVRFGWRLTDPLEQWMEMAVQIVYDEPFRLGRDEFIRTMVRDERQGYRRTKHVPLKLKASAKYDVRETQPCIVFQLKDLAIPAAPVMAPQVKEKCKLIVENKSRFNLILQSVYGIEAPGPAYTTITPRHNIELEFERDMDADLEGVLCYKLKLDVRRPRRGSIRFGWRLPRQGELQLAVQIVNDEPFILCTREFIRTRVRNERQYYTRTDNVALKLKASAKGTKSRIVFELKDLV
eukprot:35432_1